MYVLANCMTLAAISKTVVIKIELAGSIITGMKIEVLFIFIISHSIMTVLQLKLIIKVVARDKIVRQERIWVEIYTMVNIT